MNGNFARTSLLLIMAVTTGVLIWLSVWLAQESRDLSALETDRATLRSADYGILDGEQWAARLGPILAKRIERFEMTPENRAQLKIILTRVIKRLIVELPALLTESPGANKGFLGSFLGGSSREAIEMMLSASGIEERVPQMADTLIDELEKPATKKQLVGLMHGALSDMLTEQLGKRDQVRLQAVKTRHDCSSVPRCDSVIQTRITETDNLIFQRFLVLMGLAVCLLLLGAGLFAAAPGMTATLLVAGAGGLLFAGVMAPMIQIDARLADFQLTLLGDTVSFSDQVLYFQSKSILDVVQVLARSTEPEMLLVAGLIALFSIGFPVLKLLVSLTLGWRSSPTMPGPVTRFFAWQSGKWAMADVFVVAIFMAYIGIRGLVADQLSGLQGGNAVTVLETTNNTALEPGFWAFLGFALFGIMLGMLVERQVKRRAED